MANSSQSQPNQACINSRSILSQLTLAHQSPDKPAGSQHTSNYYELEGVLECPGGHTVYASERYLNWKVKYVLNMLSSILKYWLTCTIIWVHVYNKNTVNTKNIIERSHMDPQQAGYVAGNQQVTYSIVQSCRSRDPESVFPISS